MICHGIFDVTVPTFEKWGYVYEGMLQGVPGYPAGFANAPNCLFNVRIDGGLSSMLNVYGRGTNEVPPQIGLVRPVATSAYACSLAITAIGLAE